MPALAAIRYNPDMRRFYARLRANGKSGMQAIVAVMRKMMVLSYAVLRDRMPYDKNYSRKNKNIILVPN